MAFATEYFRLSGQLSMLRLNRKKTRQLITGSAMNNLFHKFAASILVFLLSLCSFGRLVRKCYGGHNRQLTEALPRFLK